MLYNPIPFPSDHFNLYKLADGVFAAIAANGGASISNAGILDLGDRTLIFDTFLTPQAARDLRLAAQELTGRDPALVINSHYHNDHIWGNQAFSPQALVLSTARTLKLIQTEGQEELKEAQETSAARLADFTKQQEAAQDRYVRQNLQLWVGYYQALVDNVPSVKVRLPDITFEHRLDLHGPSRSVKLIAFDDCHSGSDSILLLEDARIVFTADLLFVKSHPYLADGDAFNLLDALKELSALGAGILVPGHGALASPADLASNVDYVSSCIETAHHLVAQGDSSQERIAEEQIPARFEDWELSRFYYLNLQYLCTKFAADQV